MVDSTTPAHPRNNEHPKRKSTGKRLRFEIFKRDGFVCQYCGAQPPDVVLVVDHITPVAAGGTNDPMNLITACETCNQGKADKPLGDRIVRPDADLLYLETQQEIAELHRYEEALSRKERAITQIVGSLQNIWLDYSGIDWSPADHIMRQMLTKYGPEITSAAVIDVAPKVGGGYVAGEWLRYLYAVARNMAEAEEGD